MQAKLVYLRHYFLQLLNQLLKGVFELFKLEVRLMHQHKRSVDAYRVAKNVIETRVQTAKLCLKPLTSVVFPSDRQLLTLKPVRIRGLDFVD